MNVETNVQTIIPEDFPAFVEQSGTKIFPVIDPDLGIIRAEESAEVEEVFVQTDEIVGPSDVKEESAA